MAAGAGALDDTGALGLYGRRGVCRRAGGAAGQRRAGPAGRPGSVGRGSPHDPARAHHGGAGGGNTGWRRGGAWHAGVGGAIGWLRHLLLLLGGETASMVDALADRGMVVEQKLDDGRGL